jgi:hypothetical protein
LHGQCRVLVLAKFIPFFEIGQKKQSYLVELSLLRKLLYRGNSFQCRLDPQNENDQAAELNTIPDEGCCPEGIVTDL